jgi:hypothetical protein
MKTFVAEVSRNGEFWILQVPAVDFLAVRAGNLLEAEDKLRSHRGAASGPCAKRRQLRAPRCERGAAAATTTLAGASSPPGHHSLTPEARAMGW